MQNMRLDSGSHSSSGGGKTATEHKEQGPKKMTWATIASQPAKPQISTASTTVKKKGFGPPPPMIPGKHNMELTDGWDTPKNGPLVPPSPPIIQAPQPELIEKQNNSNFEGQPAWPTPGQAQNQAPASAGGNYPATQQQQPPHQQQQHQNNNSRGGNGGGYNSSMNSNNSNNNNNQNNYQGHSGGRQYNQNSSSGQHQQYNSSSSSSSHHYNDFQKPYHQHPHQMPTAPPQNHQPSAPITRSAPPPAAPPVFTAPDPSEDSILEQLRVKNQYNPSDLDLSLVDNARWEIWHLTACCAIDLNFFFFFFFLSSVLGSSSSNHTRRMTFIAALNTRFGAQRSTVISAWIKHSANPKRRLVWSTCSSRSTAPVTSVVSLRWSRQSTTIPIRAFGRKTSGRARFASSGSTWRTCRTLSCVTFAWRTTRTSQSRTRAIPKRSPMDTGFRWWRSSTASSTQLRSSTTLRTMKSVRRRRIRVNTSRTMLIRSQWRCRRAITRRTIARTWIVSSNTIITAVDVPSTGTEITIMDRRVAATTMEAATTNTAVAIQVNIRSLSRAWQVKNFHPTGYNNDYKPSFNGRGGYNNKRNDFRNDRNGDQQQSGSGGGFYRAKPEYQQNDDFGGNRGGYRSVSFIKLHANVNLLSTVLLYFRIVVAAHADVEASVHTWVTTTTTKWKTIKNEMKIAQETRRWNINI